MNRVFLNSHLLTYLSPVWQRYQIFRLVSLADRKLFRICRIKKGINTLQAQIDRVVSGMETNGWPSDCLIVIFKAFD